LGAIIGRSAVTNAVPRLKESVTIQEIRDESITLQMEIADAVRL
jgi:hypothetical protein